MAGVRQQELVKAAAKVFKIKGYHGATMQDIADEVGMLKGSLYYHIESKEKLLFEILLTGINVVHEGLKQVLESDLDPKEKLPQAIIAHLRSYETRYDEVSVFLNELVNLPEGMRVEYHKKARGYVDLWLELFREGVEKGCFRADLNPKMVVYAILGICNWTSKWLDLNGPLTLDEIARNYSEIVLKGVLSGAAQESEKGTFPEDSTRRMVFTPKV
jgi:AcrR family transcriptional regulator